MWHEMARVLVRIVGLYVAAGFVFAVPFVILGVGATDPNARRGTIGFRILLLPGAVALWPCLARRWLQGGPPRSGLTAHDRPRREAGS